MTSKVRVMLQNRLGGVAVSSGCRATPITFIKPASQLRGASEFSAFLNLNKMFGHGSLSISRPEAGQRGIVVIPGFDL